MLKILQRLLFLFIFCLASEAKATTKGCLVVATGRMYYQNPSPSNSVTYFLGSAFYENQSNCTSQYYSVASSSNANCYASYKGTGKKNKASSYYIIGKKRTFNLIACPIDDYVFPFMLILVGTAYFFIRRGNLVS